MLSWTSLKMMVLCVYQPWGKVCVQLEILTIWITILPPPQLNSILWHSIAADPAHHRQDHSHWASPEQTISLERNTEIKNHQATGRRKCTVRLYQQHFPLTSHLLIRLQKMLPSKVKNWSVMKCRFPGSGNPQNVHYHETVASSQKLLVSREHNTEVVWSVLTT